MANIRGINEGTDGRRANVYLLTPGTEVTTGALTAGTVYYITGLASSSSAITTALQADDTETTLTTGMPFICPSAGITLVEGDAVVPMTKSLLGFARDKSLSISKDTIDVTCDINKTSNQYISSGLRTVSGSVSGYDLLSNDPSSAINILRSEFSDIGIEDDDGKFVYRAATNSKYLFLFDWREENLQVGEYYDVTIQPVILSQLENSASYGSAKAFNISFQGCDSDENGYKGAYIAMKYFGAA